LIRYEFHTFKPDEDGNIDLEAFLMSIISSMHGSAVERYYKRINKVVKEINSSRKKDTEIKVSIEQYMAFHKYLKEIDSLKTELRQFRYLDYDAFENHIKKFNKANKTEISNDMIMAVFNFLDVDGSQELEEEEVMDVLGQR
jgi:Ca2+-binding EF-hand superfamily protein